MKLKALTFILVIFPLFSFADDSQNEILNSRENTGLIKILQESRLNNQSCLSMISIVNCLGDGFIFGGKLDSFGNCEARVAFRLESSETVVFPLKTQDRKTERVSSVSSDLSHMASGFTFGQYHKMKEQNAGQLRLEESAQQMKRQLHAVYEFNQEKGISNCADFKNESGRQTTIIKTYAK